MKAKESQLAVKCDKKEVAEGFWVEYEQLISCIRNNQTRFPYTKSKEKEYEEIFDQIRTKYLSKENKTEQKENGGEER